MFVKKGNLKKSSMNFKIIFVRKAMQSTNPFFKGMKDKWLKNAFVIITRTVCCSWSNEKKNGT